MSSLLNRRIYINFCLTKNNLSYHGIYFIGTRNWNNSIFDLLGIYWISCLILVLNVFKNSMRNDRLTFIYTLINLGDRRFFKLEVFRKINVLWQMRSKFFVSEALAILIRPVRQDPRSLPTPNFWMIWNGTLSRGLILRGSFFTF